MGLLEHVQNAAGVPSLVAAADTVCAVLASLLMAIDEASAQRFVAGMPPTLKTMLRGWTRDRPGSPVIRSFEEAIAQIAAGLRTDSDRARQLARDVVTGATVWLPRREVTWLKGQLPPGFAELFRHLA